MKFKHKPTIIEAEQFFPHRKPWLKAVKIDNEKPRPIYYVETLEGRMRVMAGDWIVTGTKGEIYAVKQDIFVNIYEPLEAES